MNKNKNWALMAHADGICSFLRDLTGFKLGNLLKMPWNPEDEPVELVLNGEYQGLYYISETVKVGSNRVDIFDYDDAKEEWEEKHPGETFNWTDSYKTGGWLVEIDNNIDNDQIVLKTRGSDWYNLLVTYDTPSDYITQEHIDYLKSQFDTMDRLIYEGPDENLNWFDMIDLPDAARYFIANGLMDNLESLRGSCKIWKEQEGLEKTCAFLSDGKWHFGPLWDMGSSLYRNNNFRLFCDNDGYYAHWMPKMLEYPEFRNELKNSLLFLLMILRNSPLFMISSTPKPKNSSGSCQRQRALA